MTDVLLVLITVVFFAAAVLLVKACDAIIGPDEQDLDEADESSSPAGVDSNDDLDEPVLTGAAS